MLIGYLLLYICQPVRSSISLTEKSYKFHKFHQKSSLHQNIHYVAILNWLDRNGSQDTLSEVIAAVTSPLEIDFFSCTSAHSATMYTVTSMLCAQQAFYFQNPIARGSEYFCHLIRVRVI